MSRAPFPKGGTPPWWWNGYVPLWNTHLDLIGRLQWLYGDAQARSEENKPDLEAWRQLGRPRAP
jgi:hypothetical protein